MVEVIAVVTWTVIVELDAKDDDLAVELALQKLEEEGAETEEVYYETEDD
jgi:hypothetical protein